MGNRRSRLLTALAVTALAGAGTAGAAAQDPSAAPASGVPGPAAIGITAAAATIAVDGDVADWAAIQGATVNLEQIRLANLDPEQAAEIQFGAVPPVDVSLKVATDAEAIYLLVEVPGVFTYNAEDLHLTPSLAVQFRIDDPAGSHMGADEADLYASMGMVDLWHWELECAAGTASGGKGIPGGDDPDCNFDDEFATTPEKREDDGGGDIANPAAENGLTGVWMHTASASGAGAAGTWIFEMSRPLQNGDPQDAQFASGGVVHVALAWFDPAESATGWSDPGHLNSSYNGWIEVTLP